MCRWLNGGRYTTNARFCGAIRYVSGREWIFQHINLLVYTCLKIEFKQKLCFKIILFITISLNVYEPTPVNHEYWHSTRCNMIFLQIPWKSRSNHFLIKNFEDYNFIIKLYSLIIQFRQKNFEMRYVRGDKIYTYMCVAIKYMYVRDTNIYVHVRHKHIRRCETQTYTYMWDTNIYVHVRHKECYGYDTG